MLFSANHTSGIISPTCMFHFSWDSFRSLGDNMHHAEAQKLGTGAIGQWVACLPCLSSTLGSIPGTPYGPLNTAGSDS